MGEKKHTLTILDETISAVENITSVLNTAKEEVKKLEKDKEKLSNETKLLEKEKEQLEEEKNKLERDKDTLEQAKTKLEQEKQKLEEATKRLEQEKKEKDEKIGNLTAEQMKLLDEYRKLKGELRKFAKIAQEQEEEEFNVERIKALLSIYNVLLEEIWQGTPHFRILLTLHGDKEEMSREEIKTTTGISGAMVLRAVHELDKIEIVEYNEDTSMVKLKKRLFSKKALEEKPKEE